MAFTDNFTGTSGDDLVGRSGWTQQEGTSPQKWVVDSNAIKPDATGSFCSYTCTDQGSADQYTQAKLSALTPAGNAYLAVRLVDHNNFVGFRLAGTGSVGARLVKCVGGVVTDLVTFQGVVNDVYKIEANGSTIKLFKNGTQQGTDQTVTNFTTETSQGLLTTANQIITGPLFDDFEAGALAGGGSVGSSSGTSTTTATGSSTFVSAGSSAGQSTALASGSSLFASSGTIAGQGAASSTGSATAAGSGASSCAATVNGIASGGSIQSGAGASSGQSTALASGRSTFASSGISAGQGTASSTGSAISAGAGSSSGAATISGISPGLSIVSGAGISAGSSVAASIAKWIFKSNGIASGNSMALAYSTASSSFSDQRYVLTSESKDFSITSKPDELIFYS